MATATAKTFDYQVRDWSGKLTTGQLGPTAPRPWRQSSGAGLLARVHRRAQGGRARTDLKIPGLAAAPSLHLAIFSRQFATMINSGLSLLRALHILADQTENEKLADTVTPSRTTSRPARRCPRPQPSTTRSSRRYVAISAPVRPPVLDEVLLRIAAMLSPMSFCIRSSRR